VEGSKEEEELKRAIKPWSMWKLESLVGQRGARRVPLEELKRGAKIGEFEMRVRGLWELGLGWDGVLQRQRQRRNAEDL